MKENDLGGVNDMEPSLIERAKRADLVTLPPSVRGTNCYNCKFISSHKEQNYAFCRHPSVKQNVNQRMCCALWDARGAYRPFKKAEKYE